MKEHLKEYTSKEGAAAMSRRKEGINNMQNGMAPSEAFQFPNELAPKVDEIYENLKKSDQIRKKRCRVDEEEVSQGKKAKSGFDSSSGSESD